jgi:hypothetical protein
VPDETFGYGLEIVVDERKKAEPGNEYESPLQGLEYGDQAHPASDAGAGLWLAQGFRRGRSLRDRRRESSTPEPSQPGDRS